MVSRRAARGRRAGGCGDAAAARGRKGALFFLSADVDRGVECYERLKGKGPTGAAAFQPSSTPIINALTERVTHDQLPLLTIGLGRSDASDGRVFPYVFNPPVNYWSQNTAKLRFIGQRVGGMEQLKGLKIAHVHADNDYGRETLAILDAQAAQSGFAVQHLAAPPPWLP